jgi:hypothetical protein
MPRTTWLASIAKYGLGGTREARFFERLDVHHAVPHLARQFQEHRANPNGPPPLQGGLTDGPSGGQLFLIDVYDVHVFSSRKLKRPNEPFGSERSQRVQTCAGRFGQWNEH